jgi:PAS domain S-box-containing protein
VAAAREVQRTGEAFEREVQGDDGRWFLVRIIPYHVGPRAFSGVVITLIDVTQLRDTRERVERLRQTEADIVAHMPSGLFVYDVTSDGALVLASGNAAAAATTGLDVEASIGKRFDEIWPGEEGVRVQEMLLRAYRDGGAVYEPEVHYRDDRLDGYYHIHAFRLPGNRLAVAFQDITDRKRAEERVRQSEQRFRALYHLLADAERTARMGSWTWEVATDTVTWSENLFRLFGRDPAHGAPSYAEHDPLYTPSSMARLRQAVADALRDGTPYEIELTAVREDATLMRCIARGQAERDEAGTVQRLYGSLQEILS